MHGWGLGQKIKSISSLSYYVALVRFRLNHQCLIFMALNTSKSLNGHLIWTETSKTQGTSTMGAKYIIKHRKTRSMHVMVKV